MNELQEFYPYIEMTHVAKNPEKFKAAFPGGVLPSQTKLIAQNGPLHLWLNAKRS